LIEVGLKLVAGLGNPGAKYAGTRHNIGFVVAEELAGRSGISLKKNGYQGIYGVGRVAGQEVTILLPQTFMNLSGVSVAGACKSLGVNPGDLIVVHDDIDLPYGRLRIRVGGGHGGHNGIRSIAAALGSGEFCRLKVGVGRPVAGEVADYVLSNFIPAERQILPALLDQAVAAAEFILSRGSTAAMNAFNSRDNVA
jgi:PTH1 family peptidyl-tRNA hydrolase